MKIVEEILAIIPLLFLTIYMIEAFIGMSEGLWSYTNVNFFIWQKDFHSATIFLLGWFYFVLYFVFYYKMRPIFRASFSAVIPLFGLFFHEFWWHLGCRFKVGGGIPMFWGLYASIIFICIYYLHIKYNLLKLSYNRLSLLFPSLFIFMFLWWNIVQSDFYGKLLLFDQGKIVTDPHNILTLMSKTVSIFMWMAIVNKV